MKRDTKIFLIGAIWSVCAILAAVANNVDVMYYAVIGTLLIVILFP